MSTDASAGATDDPGEDVDSTDYDGMLDALDVGIAEARRKIENGRVRSPENEKVRQGWIRTLAYTMNIKRQVANDRDLQELAEEVEALKTQYGEDTDL
jgi:SHS2 domain-containing protein